MTSGIDPITGLDTSIVDPFLYQIPLTTNPIQAPEWGFQGHYDQILHPDNIPAVFATAQGFDESNPGAAQAHHMDGEGNLYVNVRKNEAGGGGGAAPVPIVCYSLDTTTSGFGAETLMDMGPIGSTIYGLTMAFTSDDVPGSGLTKHGAVYPLIESGGASGDLFLASVAVNQVTTTTANRFAAEVTIWYGNGLIFNQALNHGSGTYRLVLQSTNIGSGHLTIAVWCSA